MDIKYICENIKYMIISKSIKYVNKNVNYVRRIKCETRVMYETVSPKSASRLLYEHKFIHNNNVRLC